MNLNSIKEKPITEEIRFHSSILWNFMTLNHKLEKADLIFVLCSHDLRIAKFAAELWHKKYSKLILFSGGLNFFTRTIFSKSEAEEFAKVAIEEGVDPDKILIESKSKNTGENIQFSKILLNELNLFPKKIIAVQKPSMTLRVSLALNKQWNDIEFLISSPNYNLIQGPNEKVSMNILINEIVGDFQRIIEYPKMGFQTSIEIPEEAKKAFNFLVDQGYTLHLINA
jgi:uncharacterized SAM-binding protein YcdF (DUF218 family)